jgi:hypothetical protein
MDGYECIFKNAASNYDKDKDKYKFDNFRSCLNIYNFILNGDPNPEGTSLTIANNIDRTLFLKYFSIPKPFIGYSSNPEKYTICDNLDSRHIMMSCFVVKTLRDIGALDKIKTVVEIGGGFGNWCRLHSTTKDIPFDKWIIIDIPHVSKLQKWYLNKVLSKEDFSKIEFVTTDKYDSWLKRKPETIDLVIASHSLSEISLSAFIKYNETLVKDTKCMFYAYHKDKPHPFLIHDKQVIIDKEFDLSNGFKTENDLVYNNFYIHKSL